MSENKFIYYQSHMIGHVESVTIEEAREYYLSANYTLMDCESRSRTPPGRPSLVLIVIALRCLSLHDCFDTYYIEMDFE